MSALPVSKDAYSSLLKRIKQEIAAGLDRARNAYNKEKVRTYWKIGRAIAGYLSKGEGRADYGKQLYTRLSQDLDVGERLLYQISQFYNAYPDFKPSQNLSWSHYRLLTSVEGEKQRSLLKAKASNNNWSKRELEDFLEKDKEKSAKFSKATRGKKKKLSIPKGRLYTYRLFKADYADNILIDCGFNIYRESENQKFSGNFAESIKTKDIYKLVKSTATAKHLYTYKTYVEKIIDGDTLWVIVDCGFKTWSKQKIRLRGINTPGITTKRGAESYKFVCKQLKGLPFIIIKSHGRDKYDRYLMDIFYLKGEEDPQAVSEEGQFLNQQLLDENLAQKDIG